MTQARNEENNMDNDLDFLQVDKVAQPVTRLSVTFLHDFLLVSSHH